MSHKVSSDQLSALRFERVWVREAVFQDVEGTRDVVNPKDLLNVEIRVEVKAKYSAQGDQAFVSVRATLEPPPGQKTFQQISAAVEGAFSVRGSVDRERLEGFATTQAPVLLLPYLRQVITSLTAQSRVGAVIIPPLNMLEITKAMKAQVKDKAVTITAKR